MDWPGVTFEWFRAMQFPWKPLLFAWSWILDSVAFLDKVGSWLVSVLAYFMSLRHLGQTRDARNKIGKLSIIPRSGNALRVKMGVTFGGGYCRDQFQLYS